MNVTPCLTPCYIKILITKRTLGQECAVRL